MSSLLREYTRSGRPPAQHGERCEPAHKELPGFPSLGRRPVVLFPGTAVPTRPPNAHGDDLSCGPRSERLI